MTTPRPSARPPITPDQMRRTGVLQFFRETWAELRRVTWPTRDETVRLTVVTIAISTAVGGALFLADALFEGSLNAFVIPK